MPTVQSLDGDEIESRTSRQLMVNGFNSIFSSWSFELPLLYHILTMELSLS